MQYIVKILIVLIIFVLCVGLAKTIYGMKAILLDKSLGQSFDSMVTDILTFLVIIELFRSFIEYFEVHRFRLNTMIDPAIVFVIRELIVKTYDNTGFLDWKTLLAMGFVIVCLGIVRTLAVKFSPEEDRRIQGQTPAG
jgi:uncharacterized membrane protein (DUF373 family)